MEISNLRHLYRTTQNRYIKYYLDLAQSNKADFDFLEMELDNFLNSMELCIAQENWKFLKSFVQCLNTYLIDIGLWDIVLKYNSALLRSDVLHGFVEKADLLSQLAKILEARGNYSEAENLYQKILANAGTSKPQDLFIVTSTLDRMINLSLIHI